MAVIRLKHPTDAVLPVLTYVILLRTPKFVRQTSLHLLYREESETFRGQVTCPKPLRYEMAEVQLAQLLILQGLNFLRIFRVLKYVGWWKGGKSKEESEGEEVRKREAEKGLC